MGHLGKSPLKKLSTLVALGVFGAPGLAAKNVFLAIGDSNSAGTGRTIGPVTPPDTLYHWTGGAVVQITTTDISTIPPFTHPGIAAYGTSYKQFAIDYKALTGKSVVMVTHGKGGANFYPGGDTDNFYPSPAGLLYEPAVAAAAAACAAVGVAQVTAVIVNLGVNDVRDGVTLANMTLGVESLFTRLETNFPGVPKLIIQVGTSLGPIQNSAALYHIREKIKGGITTRANFYMVSNNGAFYQRGVVDHYYDDQTLHLDQSGNNLQGSHIARWFTLGSYSRYVRNCLSCFLVMPSVPRQILIKNFIEAEVANSNNWLKLDMLFVFKTNALENIFLDWAAFWVPTDYVAPTVTFNANSDIQTNGTSNFFATYNAGFQNNSLPTQTDWVFGVKLKENLSPNPSSAIVAGGRLSAALPHWTLAQVSGGPGNFAINTVTGDNNAIARYPDDALLCVGRIGTQVRFTINAGGGTTLTRASTGRLNDTIILGGLNTGGVYNLFFAGKFEYAFSARYADFDLGSFYTNMETLLDNWGSSPDWILATSDWNDDGLWDDNAVWID